MYVAQRVAQHKRLRGGVVFVNKIPKRYESKFIGSGHGIVNVPLSPSGKILRVKLREYLKNTWPSLSSEEKQSIATLKF